MTAFNPPTGVLLGTYTPGTPEWEKARAGLCITATEIAAVLGLSPWASPFSLWHKKAGLPTPPFESNPAVEWGNRLEEAVAQKWLDEHEGYGLESTGTWRHRDREWQRATPDRIAFTGRGTVTELLEVKTSPFGDEWGPAGSDELPIYYRCQVQWQLDTLGLDLCHVALLVSGHDYREYVIEYDADDAKVMRDAAQEFLDTVRRGERPPIDGADATYQTIRVQPDGLEDVDVEIPLEDAARYEIAQQQHKATGDELTAAKGILLDHIGTGKRAVVGERRVAYRTVRDGKTYSLSPYTSKDVHA
ncbi:YqaJ viral recombinase family protein [Streptomyces sp. NRRL S-1824]|uniref:YqaJ viral recombinase family nuclease n=1 Tax=Streptomyces sp. NRRL S-1824 TaxID=1463889 RepID=UPI0004C8C6EE|nr:YqaJ viral recombinase family protein [Streptomyces sp. NRRL S-1824]